MSRPSPRPGTTALPRPRRGAILALALCLAVTSVWAAGASYYLLFRDALAARFLAQQDAMRVAYETRLAQVGARLDTVSADRNEEREGAEARLAALTERLAALESRQAGLAALAGTPALPRPEPETTGAIPDAGAAIELRGGRRMPGRRSEALGIGLAALEGSADALAAAQADSLERLGARSRRDLDRVRGALKRTGLDLTRFERPREGIGGPLVPVASDPFAEALARAGRARDDEMRLRRLAIDLPLGRPLLGELNPSSGFGTRLDPFTRGLALHTGIDLKAETGTSARATAAGRVVSAEAAGGYGNLVEIDHGHGVATRYAHLSSILVRPGQWVPAGGLVGLVGSTGRSTGSHLHYETRVDGEPVDPVGFLLAGADVEALHTDEAR